MIVNNPPQETYMMTANYYNFRHNSSVWTLCNNGSLYSLGGTDTTVGDTEAQGTTRLCFQTIMAIIPFNIRVTDVSCGVSDDDMDAGSNTTDKRIGVWRKAAYSASGLDPSNVGGINQSFELMWITNAFDGQTAKWLSCYDNTTPFNLDAGDIVFMGYLNPDGNSNDDVTLTMNLWGRKI